MKAVCVFAGSRMGARREYRDSARALGREIAARGHTLIFGGGSVGLMGVLAEAIMDNGGRAIGVIPEALLKREVTRPPSTDLRIVGSMHERKALMSELSDGFIALPGGLGTLEELFEMLTWAQLGIHDKPCGILNAGGYYDALPGFLDRVVEERFMSPEHRCLLLMDKDPGPLLEAMNRYTSPVKERWLGHEDA